MSIFKKKKNEQVKQAKELLQPLKLDVPEVIKASKIKPTKCKHCLTVYQAQHKHLMRERDMRYTGDRFIVFTLCPVCSSPNNAEFEDDTV